ncbi:MAG: SDR family oxidoreductase [Marinobacter sp.]|nr:SDR family oxidoreductase [Marinobacter sp.]
MWGLITGAGSGIGRALALELATRGYDLILSGRTASKLEQVAQTIRHQEPERQVITMAADFADPASTRELANRVCSSVGWLGACVYCAGAGEPAADFANMELIDFQEALTVNVSAPMLLCQSLLPVLQGGNWSARVVLVGAGIDQYAQPGTGSYGISKMAMRRLVQQMSVDFEAMKEGPVVSLFQPGLVDTPGIRRHIEQASALSLPHAEWLGGRLENGDCLTPEQAAGALAYALQQTPASEFDGAVFHGTDLVDALSFGGS